MLASRKMLTDVGSIIDLNTQKLHCTRLGGSLDLFLLQNERLAVSIVDFPKDGFPRAADAWPETDSDVSVPRSQDAPESFPPVTSQLLPPMTATATMSLQLQELI